MSEKIIITCPKCKGKGEIKKSNSQNYGILGMICTLGFINLLDHACSQKWKEECIKCDGKGKILI